jgi:hypothetical protein
MEKGIMNFFKKLLMYFGIRPKSTIRSFTSGNGTWIIPKNVQYIKIKMIGGGNSGKDETNS